MFFRLSSVVLVFALTVLGTAVKRDTVESDIENIGTKAEALEFAIKDFPNSGATLQQAWDIHEAADQLSVAFDQATEDISSSTAFTEEYSATIVQSLQSYTPLIQESSSDIISKKAALTALGIDKIAESDLTTIKTSGDAFGTALKGKVTQDQQGNVQNEVNTFDEAITEAINAYE